MSQVKQKPTALFSMGRIRPSPVVPTKPSSNKELRQLVVKRKRRPMHRNSIIFRNMPDYSHLLTKDRESAELRHEQWEWTLEDVNPGFLHRSCASLNLNKDTVPRQTMAWLIADFCDKHNLSHTTLCEYITRANEDVQKEGLMWRRETDQRPCFNLHKLSSQGLYRIYTEIPEHMRPVEKPSLEQRAPKERTLNSYEKKRLRKKEQKDARVSKLQQKLEAKYLASLPPPVEENFAWVQCDACDKWRRLMNTKEEDVPEQWECKLHPDGITCQTAEDAMDDGEQWDGNTKGTKLRINLSGAVPTVRVVDEAGDTVAPDSSSSSSDEEDNETGVPSSQPQSQSGSLPSNEGEDDDDGGDGDINSHDLFGSDDDDDGEF